MRRVEDKSIETSTVASIHKTKPYRTTIPRSQRGGEIVEPMISEQWFVQIELLCTRDFSYADQCLTRYNGLGREDGFDCLAKIQSWILVFILSSRSCTKAYIHPNLLY